MPGPTTVRYGTAGVTAIVNVNGYSAVNVNVFTIAMPFAEYRYRSVRAPFVVCSSNAKSAPFAAAMRGSAASSANGKSVRDGSRSFTSSTSVGSVLFVGFALYFFSLNEMSSAPRFEKTAM
jgi:hypothetical protein